MEYESDLNGTVGHSQNPSSSIVSSSGAEFPNGAASGAEVVRSDNVAFVEHILLTNLEIDPLLLEAYSFPPSPDNSKEAEEDKSKEVTVFVEEINMQDEDYFGADGMKTLSRVVGARVKFCVNANNSEDCRNLFWLLKLPTVHPLELDLVKAFDVYKREIVFYTEILPAMKMWIEAQELPHFLELQAPRCYYGKYTRPTMSQSLEMLDLMDHVGDADSLLVLQDLRPEGYGKRYFGKGMEVSEVFAVIREITKFHAVSHAMQVKSQAPFTWKELMAPPEFVRGYEALFKSGFELLRNFLSNRGEDDVEGDGIMAHVGALNGKIKEVLTSLITPPTQSHHHHKAAFPLTLIHMDLWSDNLLLRVKDDEMELPLEEADLDCVIIDWQMCGLGKPSHDLAMLIILSMDPELRRDASHTLLQYYYQCFEQTIGWFGIEEMPFTIDELIIEFSNSCLLAVIMAVASMDIVLMEESTQFRLMEAIKDLITDGILSFDNVR